MSIKKINGYTIFLKEVLGKGSYGSVYKGEQDDTKLPCAVKMLNKKNIDSDQYLKTALFSEIQVLKSVKCQNVVGFFDVMESSQNYYIIQELCDGDLEKLLRSQNSKLPEEKALKILTQICNGFLALVRQGIVHRDLKPANLMTSQGVIKIGDFGFAKKNPNQRVKNQTAVGTPLYMPVQILKGEPYTSKCDIWALGFIFYEMLHGFTPWTAATQFELVKNIENKPLKINPALSENTKDFLIKTLKAKQSERISWDSLFLHPIFNHYFDKYSQGNKQFQNKMKKVMGDLRFMINSQNIDLKKLFDALGYAENHQLNFKQFQHLMRTVNPSINGEEEVFFFQKLDINNNNSISLKELENEMQKNNISLHSKFREEIPLFENRTESLNKDEHFGKYTKDLLAQSLQKKIRQCFVKLYKILNIKNISLYSTFCSYDSDKSGQLQFQQFSRIIKKLDNTNTLNEEQLSLVFGFLDIDKSKTISFDEFNSYYCKVNGVPESLNVPAQYRFMKKQENNKYYQQMKQMNGTNFVLEKLNEAFKAQNKDQ